MRARAWRRDEGGQLMMLAGIVLTLSFILTALTLSQVSALEREAAGDRGSPVIAEWRFLHERVKSNFQTAIGPETTFDAFNGSALPVIAATFRSIEAEKGYDTIIRPANGTIFAQSEIDLVAAGRYAKWSDDGKVYFDHVYDGRDDGVIWKAPCPDPSGPAAGCIAGVYVFVRLSDGVTTMEETMLIAVNRP